MNEKFSSCNNRDVAITWTISESIGGVSVSKSCLTLATPWTVACQAPLSMEFSRQEYWSGLPFPSSGDLPDPGIKPTSLCLLHQQVGSVPLDHLKIRNLSTTPYSNLIM